jgi:hypothetical protein
MMHEQRPQHHALLAFGMWPRAGYNIQQIDEQQQAKHLGQQQDKDQPQHVLGNDLLRLPCHVVYSGKHQEMRVMLTCFAKQPA